MAAATMYVTVAGAGDKSGSSWSNAMDLAAWEADVVPNAEAGDVYNLYSDGDDVYTITGSLACDNDGTSTAPIYVIGVSDQGTPPTEATGSARPTIAIGANALSFDNYWQIRGFQFTGTGTNVARGDEFTIIRNCKGINSSGSADRIMFRLGGGSAKVIACEAICTNGRAVFIGGNYQMVVGCYIHDSKVGILTGNSIGGTCLFNIFDSCSDTGLSLGITTGHSLAIAHNTFYSTVTGIYGNDLHGGLIWGNIVSDCSAAAATWDANYADNVFDFNDWYNNTTTTNVTKGDNDQTVDPQFTDAPNGDFSIGTNLKGDGSPGVFPGGLSTGYLDVGAVQRQEVAGGGMLVHPGMSGGARG